MDFSSHFSFLFFHKINLLSDIFSVWIWIRFDEGKIIHLIVNGSEFITVVNGAGAKVSTINFATPYSIRFVFIYRNSDTVPYRHQVSKLKFHWLVVNFIVLIFLIMLCDTVRLYGILCIACSIRDNLRTNKQEKILYRLLFQIGY